MYKVSYEIPDSMVDRLMKENLWSHEYTLRAIEEYKDFITLAIVDSVAPSFPVDQVWHAHMLYSKSYKKMCDSFGSFIHHQPTEKSKGVNFERVQEMMGLEDEYTRTKRIYKETYKKDPPADIWPDWTDSHYAYIDLKSHWVVPYGDIKALITIIFKHLKTKLNGII